MSCTCARARAPTHTDMRARTKHSLPTTPRPCFLFSIEISYHRHARALSNHPLIHKHPCLLCDSSRVATSTASESWRPRLNFTPPPNKTTRRFPVIKQRESDTFHSHNKKGIGAKNRLLCCKTSAPHITPSHASLRSQVVPRGTAAEGREKIVPALSEPAASWSRNPL